MNIFRENIDELNAVLNIKLEKSDYEARVEDVLKDYRKKVKIDGFRPGKVPAGLVNKMYRKPVLVEEINKLVSESVTKYISDEKLNLLGEPIPHAGEQKTINWDLDTEFEFKFDMGIAPVLDIAVTAKDKIPYYQIKVDKELIDKYIENYTQRSGEFIESDSVDEKDLVKASVVQLDASGNVLENGIQNPETTLAVDVIKDEKIKKQMLAAKKGDVLTINLKKAYPSDAEIAGMLKIDKSLAEIIEGDFQLTVNSISRFQKAEVNQELFDKIYGEGVVTTEKEFREKISEEAVKNLALDSDYRFKIDVKETLIKKFKSELPKEFLKRWILLINEGKFTIEQIEAEYDQFEVDLKWQLIKDKLTKENNLELTETDIMKSAKDYAQAQFSQYGMGNIPEEHLIDFAKRMLEREEERKNIINRAGEEKIFDFVKANTKLEEKEITTEKFNKLFEK